jgi:uncharacterized pyridoxal phosphate-containing UPF0001 family protein
MSETDIRANLVAVQERIADAARRAGRREDAVLLVAVSKTVDAGRVRDAGTSRPTRSRTRSSAST